MASNIKTIIFGITSFAAGYSLNLHSVEAPMSSAITIHSNDDASRLPLSKCESRNLQLENRIHEIANHQNSCTGNLASPTLHDRKQEKEYQTDEQDEKDEQKLKSQLAYLGNYYLENEVRKLQELLKSSNTTPDKIPLALSDIYQKDTFDNRWAPEKKALLDDYIAKNTLLSSLPNVETDCKSKQCKISILSDDPIALSHLAEHLRHLANGSDFSAYGVTTDEKNHTTNIYLDRVSTN